MYNYKVSQTRGVKELVMVDMGTEIDSVFTFTLRHYMYTSLRNPFPGEVWFTL